MTEDYVSFEIAKLLKEKGFDEVCFRYAESKEIYESGDWYVGNVTGGCIGVPTLQMAMKWLREKHIVIVLEVGVFYADGSVSSWDYHILCGYNYEEGQYSFSSYEEACEAAIKYCLENLI